MKKLEQEFNKKYSYNENDKNIGHNLEKSIIIKDNKYNEKQYIYDTRRKRIRRRKK